MHCTGHFVIYFLILFFYYSWSLLFPTSHSPHSFLQSAPSSFSSKYHPYSLFFFFFFYLSRVLLRTCCYPELLHSTETVARKYIILFWWVERIHGVLSHPWAHFTLSLHLSSLHTLPILELTSHSSYTWAHFTLFLYLSSLHTLPILELTSHSPYTTRHCAVSAYLSFYISSPTNFNFHPF